MADEGEEAIMADNKIDKLRNLKAENKLETEELDQVPGGTMER